MDRPITVAVAGCGNRGWEMYAKIVAEKLSDQMQVVAAADLKEEQLELMRKTCPGLREDRCFHSADEMLAQGKLADVMFICTPDRNHYVTAMAALRQGYHLLLEKPIAITADECRDVARLATEMQRHVVVCHVLRYTPFYTKLKELLKDEVIGKLMVVRASENVGYWHQAHSFTRGNWRNADLSTPMILQKCCHDMDILLWLTGKHCLRVTSFGHSSYFNPQNAPQGAPMRCTDGCPAADTCPFNAVRFYMGHLRSGRTGWPVSVVCAQPNEQRVMEALRNGPYGRCVFHCDNNVVDHQIVNLELEDDLEVSFVMCGFTEKQERTIRLMGTKGEIVGNVEKLIIQIQPFGGEMQEIDVSKLSNDFSGHGGGDVGLLREFAHLLATGDASSSRLTSIHDSIESHVVALAAEDSRLDHGRTIDLV